MRFNLLNIFVITAIVAAAVEVGNPKASTTDLVAVIVTKGASPLLVMFVAKYTSKSP